jgi:transposase
MRVASIGIDLGKTTFHLVALGDRNKVLIRKKFSRAQLFAYTAKLPASLIGLEACAGAHFLGSKLREQGHEVRLIPAQFIKPYRKSNKNDLLDAEAIAEAVTKEEHALRADQDGGAARRSGHASRSGSARAASHGAHQ